MQLRYINLIVLLLIGLSLSSVASCSQANITELKWESISVSEMLIDVTLPSGVEVKGIRYRKEKLAKKWLLQLKSTSGTTIHSSQGRVNSLSQRDFKDLFAELISFIKKNNDGQLDRVQLGLGIITELWEDTASFLRKGAVPPSYKLKPKDLNLAKKISSHLKDSPMLKALCEEAVQIQKVCKNNFVSMNPITFEQDYIGKEWSQVNKLPNTGVPLDELWFSLNLRNK